MPSQGLVQKPIDRRRFVSWSAAAVGGLSLPGASTAAAATTAGRKLNFYNIHTGESLSAVYWEGGHYLADSLSEIDYVLRDFRTGEIHGIDPHLLDLVHRLRSTLDHQGQINVISGYRCPATNAMLARRSKRVAKNSYHLKGMAIDLRLPGRRLEDVRAAAIWLAAGGVGYYPESDFVHMDTGAVRTW